MSKLFIELYIDEDVDILVAELVRARGFSAITTRDAGGLTKTDEEQLDFAVNQQATMLTHNRLDFERLAGQYILEDKTHYGIILATRHSPYEITRRLLLILNEVTADEMKNNIRYI